MASTAIASLDELPPSVASADPSLDSSKAGSCEGLRCLVCSKVLPADDLISAAAVPPSVGRLIRRDHPAWSESAWICGSDLNRFRLEHVKVELGDGCGIISDLESDVLQSLRADQVLAEDANRQYDRRISRSGRLVQLATTLAGSWSFLTSFTLLIAAWIAISSTVLPGRTPDLYAFIVVNTVLSGICALQAPIVLMGFRQREERQRLHAEIEYKRSLKAEVLMRELSEKVDHLLNLEARHASAVRPGSPLSHSEARSPAPAARVGSRPTGR